MPFDSFYAPNYTLLRTLSSQVAESTPTAGTFTITLSNSPYADILIVGSAVGGTVSPDIVIFEVWGLYNTTSGTQVVTKLDTIMINAVDIATAQLRNVRTGCDKVWVTARFSGGTSPTVSATIYARVSWSNLLTKSDFTFDADCNLYNRSLAYDSATASDKTFPIYDVSDKYSNEVPAELTGTAVVTANYDIDMRGYRNVVVQITATSGTADSVKFAFLTTKDPTTTNLLLVTPSGNNFVTNSNLSADSSGDISVPTSATNYDIHYDNIGCLIFRIRITAASHASNSLKIYVYKYY